MKSQYRKLFAFVALLVAVSLACMGGTQPTSAPVPTNPPPPTSAPVEQPQQEQPPQAPQQDAPAASQQFFTEEFDTQLSDAWSTLTVTGSSESDPDDVSLDINNGKLVWDFDSKFVYYYLFYQGANYTDVKVEVRADNRGANNNNVSLICRYDPDFGWYEFNIANNGLYDIYFAEIDQDGNIGYNRITNGGSNFIKQGKDVNEYGITCVGDELTLFINGREQNSITERRYALREGGVGVSVSSFNVLPVLVEMDWFKISEP